VTLLATVQFYTVFRDVLFWAMARLAGNIYGCLRFADGRALRRPDYELIAHDWKSFKPNEHLTIPCSRQTRCRNSLPSLDDLSVVWISPGQVPEICPAKFYRLSPETGSKIGWAAGRRCSVCAEFSGTYRGPCGNQSTSRRSRPSEERMPESARCSWDSGGYDHFEPAGRKWRGSLRFCNSR
jgi:hypothetical protein